MPRKRPRTSTANRSWPTASRDSVEDLAKKAGLKGAPRRRRAERIRAARVLDHSVGARASLLGIYLRVSRIQNARRQHAGDHRRDLLRAFSSPVIISPAARMGSRGLFVLRRRFRPDRNSFFRALHHVFGVVGVFLMLASLLWAMIDRYPGETFFPTGDMLAVPLRQSVFHFARAPTLIIMVLARYLPKTSLPPFRAHDDESARAVAGRNAPAEFATAPNLSPGMEGTAANDAAPERQRAFRRSRIDVITKAIRSRRNADHGYPERWDARGLESARLTLAPENIGPITCRG